WRSLAASGTLDAHGVSPGLWRVRGRALAPSGSGAPEPRPGPAPPPPCRDHHGRQRALGHAARAAPGGWPSSGCEGGGGDRPPGGRARHRLPHPLRVFVRELAASRDRGLLPHDLARADHRRRAPRSHGQERLLPRDRPLRWHSPWRAPPHRARGDGDRRQYRAHPGARAELWRTRRDRGRGARPGAGGARGRDRSGGHRRGRGGAGALHRRHARSRPAHPDQRGDAGVELSPLADRLYRALGDAHALAGLRSARPLRGRRRLPAPRSPVRARVRAGVEDMTLPGTVAVPSRGAALMRRALSTVVLLPLFLWLVMAGPLWLYGAIIVLVGALGQWEFTGMFERAGVRTMRALGLMGGVLVTASFALPVSERVVLTAVLLGALTAALWWQRLGQLEWQPTVVTVFGILYVNWLLGYAFWLRDLEAGKEWVLLLVWVTWLGETAAYMVGSTAGRHRLAPL